MSICDTQATDSSNTWYQEFSQEDQNKYQLDKSYYIHDDCIKALIKDGRFDLIKAALKANKIYDAKICQALLNHQRVDLVCQWFYDGTWEKTPSDLIANLMEHNHEDCLQQLLKDGKISKIDVIEKAIVKGYPSYVDKVLTMGLSDKEAQKFTRSLSSLRWILNNILDKNQDAQYQALAKFVQKIQNPQIVDALFTDTYNEHFCGRILRTIKPEFVLSELANCKEQLVQDHTLTQEQKSGIANLYTQTIFETDRTQTPCSLPTEQMRTLQDLNLNVWQLIKYFPNSLFETKTLLSSKQSTITHFMLINYLIKAKNRRYMFETKTRESILYQAGIYDQLLKIESEMGSEGYSTFVHGRCWHFKFSEDIENLVHAVRTGQKNLPPTTIMPWKHSAGITPEEILKKRKAIIERGARSEHDGACFNSSILSNNCEPDSYAALYSAAYFTSKSFHDSSAQAICTNAGMPHLFERYKKSFEDLHQSHKECSTTGELVVASIKNEYISDLMYVAGLQAKKVVDEPAGKWLSQTLMNAYEARKNHTDGCYFYFAMPDAPGERERGDYIIQSIHAADPEKYAAYRAKLQKLFETIKAEHQGSVN